MTAGAASIGGLILCRDVVAGNRSSPEQPARLFLIRLGEAVPQDVALAMLADLLRLQASQGAEYDFAVLTTDDPHDWAPAWISAGKLLMAHPSAVVLCPVRR